MAAAYYNIGLFLSLHHAIVYSTYDNIEREIN
jgi:hypothetical protein